MDNAQVTQMSSRASRYLSDQKAAQENLATYPESTRQRLEAWQTKQSEWFDNVILEIVSEFITVDDALRAERSEPVGWMGIESAPKDGSVFFAWCPNVGRVIMNIDGVHRNTWAVDRTYRLGCNPTHWMPLPSAPGTTPPEPVAEIERLRELLREAEQREIDLMAELSGTDQINITLVDLVRRAMRLLPEGKSLWWDEAKGVMDLVDASHAIATAALGEAS